MNTPICTGFDSPLGLDRRHFLQTFGMGFGGLALADLMHAALSAKDDESKLSAIREEVFAFNKAFPMPS
jgi:hypothetical protein